MDHDLYQAFGAPYKLRSDGSCLPKLGSRWGVGSVREVMDCTCSIATINGLYIPLPSDMDSSCVDIDMPVCHCVRARSPHMSISISPAQAIPELPEPPQLSPSLRPVTRLADRQPILDRTILSMPDQASLERPH